MGLLEGAQLAHEGVVLGVGDLGFVELVVADVVVLDLLTQLGDACSGVHGDPDLAAMGAYWRGWRGKVG